MGSFKQHDKSAEGGRERPSQRCCCLSSIRFTVSLPWEEEVIGEWGSARAITHAARCAACLAPSPTKGLAQLGRPEQNELLHFSQPRGSMRVGERLNEKLVGR